MQLVYTLAILPDEYGITQGLTIQREDGSTIHMKVIVIPNVCKSSDQAMPLLQNISSSIHKHADEAICTPSLH